MANMGNMRVSSVVFVCYGREWEPSLFSMSGPLMSDCLCYHLVSILITVGRGKLV